MCLDFTGVTNAMIAQKIAQIRHACDGGRPMRDNLTPTLQLLLAEQERRAKHPEGQNPSDLKPVSKLGHETVSS